MLTKTHFLNLQNNLSKCATKLNTDLERTAMQTRVRHYETCGRHFETSGRHYETRGRHYKRLAAILDVCTLLYTLR